MPCKKNFHRVTVACYFLLWRSMCIFCPSCPPFCSSTTWASRILPILSSNKNSLQTTAIYFLFFQAGNSTICRCNAGKPHVSISTKNFVRQGEKGGNNQKPRSTKLPAALLSKTMKKSDTGIVIVKFDVQRVDTWVNLKHGVFWFALSWMKCTSRV